MGARRTSRDDETGAGGTSGDDRARLRHLDGSGAKPGHLEVNRAPRSLLGWGLGTLAECPSLVQKPGMWAEQPSLG